MKKLINNNKETLEEFEDWREKPNKSKIIITTLVTIVIICLAAYIGYFYIYLSPKKYLDKISVDVTSNLNNFLNNAKITEKEEVDKKYDHQIKGKLAFHKDSTNILSIDYDIKNSPKKLITSIDTDISSNNNKLLKGNIFFQDNYVYVNSKEIFSKTLGLNLKDIVTSENNTSSDEMLILTNLEDLQYYVTKMITYHAEALKEVELSSKPKNISEKEYHLKIDAEAKLKASKKLDELIKEDNKLNSIIKKYAIEDYNHIKTGEIVLIVGVMKNEIKSFIVSTNDYDIEGFIEDDLITIIKGKEKCLIHLNENNIKIEEYIENALDATIELNKTEDGASINLMIEEDTFSFAIKKSSENIYDIELNFHEQESNLEIKLSGTLTVESDLKYQFKGNGNIEVDKEAVTIDFELFENYEENLLDRLDTKNVKDIETLTADEQVELFDNIEKIIAKTGLVDYFSENLTPVA